MEVGRQFVIVLFCSAHYWNRDIYITVSHLKYVI
jgi:hypothetical protein